MLFSKYSAALDVRIESVFLKVKVVSFILTDGLRGLLGQHVETVRREIEGKVGDIEEVEVAWVSLLQFSKFIEFV